MSNLVGTGLNQVPTNGMLGGLAYQDPNHASIKDLDLKNLSQINSEIADTAVDVFVYDTRKDSDGGAWRKRTQNTSWYNETLGTATRGTRKEFPAVAVIVAESDKVTIYDGDDPDLPMWMVLNADSSDPTKYAIVRSVGETISSLYALNGIICDPVSYNGLFYQNFVEDACYRVNTTNTIFGGSIVNRNGGMNFALNVTSSGIVHTTVNDVAMTVLPNAPVDSATGLPIPTIAVATDGGVSVIQNDGNVTDFADILNGSRAFKTVTITGTDIAGFNWNNGTVQKFFDAIGATSDSNVELKYNYTASGGGGGTENVSAILRNTFTSDMLVERGKTVKDLNVGNGDGLTRVIDGVDRSYTENVSFGVFDSAVAYATTSYNTGWMHGDIKGAFLSGISTANAAVAYYDDFVNNDKGWAFADNGSSTISGGNLVLEQNGNARAYDVDALNGVATGTKLVFTGTVSGSGTGTFIIDDDGAGAGVGGVTNYGSVTSTGSFNFTATKTASNRIRFFRTSGSNNYDINFINITTEYDRSVNAKGLSVYGTVTKTAVATGADLVAYSGFSASNYLEQPYNSSLGLSSTDSVTIIFWIKQASHNNNVEVIFGTGQMATGQARYVYTNAGRPSLDTYGGASNNSTTVITDDTWHHLVAIYTPSGGFIYIDGTLDATPTYGASGYVSPSGSPQLGTRIGCERTGALPTPAYVSLLRISNSVPSAEQIKKIYDDEKFLFQENAKATLYGSSDAVTALAYDDTTELLHVGTSAGRSEFQGLRRINNTTTAVTTAISASNDLVAEQ